MLEHFFILLLLLQIKHFICDYPLQNQFMLKKANKEGWFIPLLAHSAVHSVGTFIVFCFISFNMAFCFAIADLILHFIVDRLKASPNIGNRWTMDKPQFWWALGLDQMAHHLINIIFVYILISCGV